MKKLTNKYSRSIDWLIDHWLVKKYNKFLIDELQTNK